MNTSSGRRTFSSSVIEPNSAPDWYITPNLRRIASRVVAVGGDDVVAVDVDVPGDQRRTSPIMCFSSVLLPQPEPPRITNTSPRRTSN